MSEKTMIYCVCLNTTIDVFLEISHFTAGGTFKIEAQEEFPVGKGVSVALGLKTLDTQVEVLCCVGEDDVALYENTLKLQEIPHKILPMVGKTRQNLTIYDPAVNRTTHIRFPGFKATNTKFDPIFKYLREKVQPGD